MSNPFETFKDNPLFAKIEDFHEGIVSAYERGEIEHGGLEVKTAFISKVFASSRSESSIVKHIGQDFYLIYEEDMIEEINVYLSKILFFDEEILGEVLLRFQTTKIIHMNYDTGIEVGNGIVDVCNFVKNGIGKEIFDSIILYLVKRRSVKERITAKLFKVDTHSVHGYSIEAQIDYLVIYIEIEDINNLDDINIVFTGIAGQKNKVKLTPKLLEKMREGRRDLFRDI